MSYLESENKKLEINKWTNFLDESKKSYKKNKSQLIFWFLLYLAASYVCGIFTWAILGGILESFNISLLPNPSDNIEDVPVSILLGQMFTLPIFYLYVKWRILDLKKTIIFQEKKIITLKNEFEKLKKIEKSKLLKNKQFEKERIEKLQLSQKNILERIDKNNNGQVDGLEHRGFDIYLESNETKISKINKEHVRDFVMVSNHLQDYKNNIQSIFSKISKTKNQEELNHYVNVLESNVEAWQLIQANGIFMIDSLVSDKNLQFYRIYQNFEKLGIFDSTWQKNISNQLELVNVNLNQLIGATQSMSDGIISSIGDLTYATQQQAQTISKNISSLDSSVKFGNLLSAINIYQSHRTNKKLN